MSYCSKACQLNGWKIHKYECKMLKFEVNSMRAYGVDVMRPYRAVWQFFQRAIDDGYLDDNGLVEGSKLQKLFVGNRKPTLGAGNR